MTTTTKVGRTCPSLEVWQLESDLTMGSKTQPSFSKQKNDTFPPQVPILSSAQQKSWLYIKGGKIEGKYDLQREVKNA